MEGSMLRAQAVLMGAGALCLLLAGGTDIRAQGRFTAVARSDVESVPRLQIVTIRDTVQQACYIVFMTGGAPKTSGAPRGEPPPLEDPTAVRDRRLQELSTEFERALYASMPGTLGPNTFKFQWEGQKVLGEFERAFFEREFARLEDAVRQIETQPSLAVSGPVSCEARPASTAPHKP
jgi:hypothetical protein